LTLFAFTLKCLQKSIRSAQPCHSDRSGPTLCFSGICYYAPSPPIVIPTETGPTLCFSTGILLLRAQPTNCHSGRSGPTLFLFNFAPAKLSAREVEESVFDSSRKPRGFLAHHPHPDPL
jgi:hypothetical protein